MNKRTIAAIILLGILATVVVACAAPAAQAPAIQTVVVTVKETAAPVVQTVVAQQTVVVAGTPQVQVITATPPPEQQQLTVFEWWTGPGEKEAADAMFKAMADKYPDVKVIANPVPGGGGVNQRAVLAARLTAGLPPDTFQTLGGAELKNYVDSNALQPLDDFYASTKYGDVIPGPLKNAVTINGHPYSVPLNMHLQNILYYDKKLFDELKITPPTSYDELIAACETIKKAHPDLTCLASGGKEKWEYAFDFDSIFLQEAGPADYVKFYKGELDPATYAPFKTALTKYQNLIKYMNDDSANLTWDQAVGLVGAKKAAMTLMGTWAIGAFIQGSKWQPGVDFGAVTFPQKPDRVLLFHPDTYGLATGAPDPEATKKWLAVVASPELQIPTDVTQGGLFARTDIDPTKFPDPIRQELQTYVSKNPGKLILDQHGSILPASAQSAYWDIMSTFTSQPDVAKAIADVAKMMTTYDVKNASSWYNWP